MKSEELAAQWCQDHPDATLEQAFMAGLGHKMNMNKDSLSCLLYTSLACESREFFVKL